jgi:hypothetical protein
VRYRQELCQELGVLSVVGVPVVVLIFRWPKFGISAQDSRANGICNNFCQQKAKVFFLLPWKLRRPPQVAAQGGVPCRDLEKVASPQVALILVVNVLDFDLYRRTKRL